MTTVEIVPTSPVAADVAGPVADRFPALFARLLARAVALIGDDDEAEDLAQETLVAAWRGGDPATTPDLDRLLTERCRCWQAERRALRAALGRLVAAGEPLPAWLAGPATPADREAVIEAALMRLAIDERLGGAPIERTGVGATAGADATTPRPPRASLPAVPTDLAEACPVAAALVRAGAPVAPRAAATTPQVAATGRRRHGRAGPRGGVTAEMIAALARHDRLLAQLPERERAVERAARRLDEVRRRYDRAYTAEARVAAETALLAAAVRHERALAARRDLARRLADLRATPGLAAALARRERRR